MSDLCPIEVVTSKKKNVRPLQLSGMTSTVDATTPILSHGSSSKHTSYGLDIDYEKKGMSYIVFASLGLCGFLDGLGLSMGVPFLPPYVISHFHATEIASGTLFSMYGFGSMFGFLFFFPLKYIGLSSKNILIVNLAVLLVSSILFSCSGESLIMMDISRFLQGVPFNGVYSICASFVEHFYPTLQVGTKISQLYAYWSVGVFIGPFIGSWLFTLGNGSITLPFLVLSFGCIITIVLVVMKLPNIYDGQNISMSEMCHQIVQFKDVNICVGFAFAVFYGWSYMYVESIVAIYFASTVGWGPHITAYLFMFSSACYTVIAVFAGKITEKLGFANAICISSIMSGFGIFITCVPIQFYVWGFIGNSKLILFFLEAFSFCIFGGFIVFMTAPSLSIISESIVRLELDSSFVYATLTFFTTIGYTSAPLIASALAHKYGFPFAVIIGFSFYILFGIIAKILVKDPKKNNGPL